MENKQIENILGEVGFTKGESAVYLTLLKIGETKVGSIIKSASISRSKVYDILDRLIKKGVVSKIDKNNILYFQALSPKTLFTYLKEKEAQIKKEVETLQKALPTLTSLLPEQSIDIKVYQGVDGFKRVIERTLTELRKGDIYEAMGVSKTTEFMRLYALKLYQNQEKIGFKARSIFDKEGAFKIKERKTKHHEIRVLPKGWHTPALFTLYQEVIGIHVGNDEQIISIVIKNKDVAQSFKTTFEAMWKISEK